MIITSNQSIWAPVTSNTPITSTGTTLSDTILSSGTGVISGIQYGGGISILTSPTNNTISIANTINTNIMQNKVAVFKITRDEDEKIVKTEFLKEMWVETKNGQSVEFQVARDKDLAKYEVSELSIKVISTLTF
jgi:hypothetical protein